MEPLKETTFERTLELENELSGLLDILNEKAKEVVSDKVKENPKNDGMEKETNILIDLTKSQEDD